MTVPQWAVTAGGKHKAAGQHTQHYRNDDPFGERVVRLACGVGSIFTSLAAAPGQTHMVQLEDEPAQ